MRFSILIVCFLLTVVCTGRTAYKRNKNIITVGEGYEMRSFSLFGGTPEGASLYTAALNLYKDSMPGVRIYSMIIPTAVQYYCPEELQKFTRDESLAISSMYDRLHNVTPVNVVQVLNEHKNEPIYLRTDHHWAPLGAYYAAMKFSEIAKVPFMDLSFYDRRVLHNFCGTMPSFGGDVRLKSFPEDFVYYTPKDSSYITTFVSHTKTGVKGVYALSKPFTGKFFQKYKDGSTIAYSTFMGGDSRTTHVQCFGKNARKLMIIKDSFGNALPGYLFYSFSDIYVVDFRYFQRNIIDYVRENGITDILFANNMQHACSKSTSQGLLKMLRR